MARHEYYRPSDERSARMAGTAVFAIVVVLFFATAWGIIVSAGAAQLPLLIPLLVFVFVVVLVWRIRSLQPRGARDIQAAQLARLRERIPEAIEQCRVLLQRGLPSHERAHVLVVLGECAEMEGDFAEAASLFTRAEGILRAARMNAVARVQQLAVVAARRAFAHAACGELDRAEATLRTAGARDGVPLAGSLTSRAMLLVLARRGLTQQVNERLVTDGKLLRNALAYRDRALVAVIAAYASSRTPANVAAPPELARWVASAFPESKSMLGVA